MSKEDLEPIFSLLRIWHRPNMKEMEHAIKKCVTEASKKYGLPIIEIIGKLLSNKGFLEFLFGDLQSLPFDVIKHIALQNCGALNVLLTIDKRLRRDFNKNKNEYYRHLAVRWTDKAKSVGALVERTYVMVCGKLQSIDDEPSSISIDNYITPIVVPNGRVTNLHRLEWHDRGIISRKKGPAVITYFVIDGDKKLVAEEWYDAGFRHRKVIRDKDGKASKEILYNPHDPFQEVVRTL